MPPPRVRKQTGTRTPPARSSTKPGVSYPNAGIEHSVIIIESKTVDSKDTPDAYGATHPSVPDAKLIDQSYSNEADNQKLRTRVYAAYGTPGQQDAYNYTLSFLANSLPHRVVTRVYTIPREGYAPLAKKTADTVFPEAKLTDETTAPIDGDKYHWRVLRIYEELPGPILTGRQIDDQKADGETSVISVQTVWNDAAEPTFDAKSLTYTRQAIDTLKSQQTISVLPAESTFPLLAGSELDRTTGVVTPFTSQIVPAGTTGGDVTPLNKYQSRQRIITPNAAIEAILIPLAGSVNIDVPDVLTGVAVVWEEPKGDGSYDETGTGAATGKSVNLSMSMRGSGQGSAAVIPAIRPTYVIRDGSNVPCIEYYFFVPNGTSRAAILAKAGASGDWPRFKRDVPEFVLQGQKVSISCNVNARCGVSISNTDVSVSLGSGKGRDRDFGPSIRNETLRPCIHGSINLSGSTTKNVIVTAAASADTGSGTNYPGASAADSFTETARGAVTPTILNPTSPAAVPISGLYAASVDCELYRDGYTACRVRVIDASIFA